MEAGRAAVTSMARRPAGVHVPEEAVEDLGRIQRTGRALRVILDRLDGQLMVAQALDRTVVEVALADVEARPCRQRLRDDLDLVVLGRDRDAPAALVPHRVVGGVMAEAQPARAGTRGARHDLMPQADAQQRPTVGDDLLRQAHRTGQERRIAGARGEDHAVHVGRQHLRGRRRVWQHAHARATPVQGTDDVGLETKVHDGDHRPAVTHLVGRVGRHACHEVLCLPGRDRTSRCHGRLHVHVAGSGDDAAQRTALSQVSRQCPRVQTGHGRHAGRSQKVHDLASSPKHAGRGVPDDQAAQPGPLRLIVVGETAVIPDEREGHDHHLTRVAGVGADLLVAGLGSVDHEVTPTGDRRTEGQAPVDHAILERQQARPAAADAGVDHGLRGQGQRWPQGGLARRGRRLTVDSARGERGHAQSTSLLAARDRDTGLR